MNRIDELRELCFHYDYMDIDAFGNLLEQASIVIPSVDREISNLLNVSMDSIALWRDGTIIPNDDIQRHVVSLIKNELDCLVEETAIVKNNSMTVYSSNVPADYIPNKIPFYQPLLSHIVLQLRSLIAYFKSSDISKENVTSLVNAIKMDRESIFHARLARHVVKCNKAILKSVKKNQSNSIYMVGRKTVENVRIAKAIKNYLYSIGFLKVGISFEYVYTREGYVYIDINLQ